MTATARTTAEQPRTAEDLVARLGDTVAEQGDELHELRAAVSAMRIELADLRHELTTEVRTHRLVVLGADDSERITTTCTDHSTTLSVEIVPTEDPGFGGTTPVTTALWAQLNDGCAGVIGKASVELATGDDAYCLLEQTATLSDDEREVAECGSLELFQKHWQRDVAGVLQRADHNIVRIDGYGLTERSYTGDCARSYSPMIRLPQ